MIDDPACSALLCACSVTTALPPHWVAAINWRFIKCMRLTHAHSALRCTATLRFYCRYAFFHCAKAYLRSRLWEPASWETKEPYAVSFGQYFSGDEAEVEGMKKSSFVRLLFT